MQLEQFLKFPVEPDAHWQGGVFDLGQTADGIFPDSPEASVRVALWVTCEWQAVQAGPLLVGTEYELLVSKLVEFVESANFEYRPALISVVNKELASQLSQAFANSGTEIVWTPKPELWWEFREDIQRDLSDAVEATSGISLASSDCSASQIRAYGEAATAFYRAGLWRFLGDADLLKIVTPKPMKYLKYAMVLGAGGSEFGLGFYDSSDTHWDMRAGRLDMDSFEAFSLTFNPISEAIEEDVKLWREYDIPLDNSDAFPQLLFYSRNGTRPPKPKELEYLTILLKGLADTREGEIDSGEWSKEVVVEGKKRRCKISIPDLLNPPDRKAWIDRGFMPERRSNERHFDLVQAAISANATMDLDQLNEMLQTQFTGPVDDFAFPSATPFDRVKNLCYDALETYGRRRIQLVREALSEDPTHLEANVLLAESTVDIEQRIELFEQAVALGNKQFAELLKNEVGNFWLISETRPLMRAKYGLADALARAGQANEAIAEMLDMLRLNENDNLGVRHEVVPLLLTQNREKEANTILEQYREETASWLYSKAQIEFRVGGPSSRTAQKSMAAAFEFNSYVMELLSAHTPPMIPGHYVLGSREEAAVVVNEQMQSWLECEGFIQWMAGRHAVWQRETLKRDRIRTRKKLSSRKRQKPRK